MFFFFSFFTRAVMRSVPECSCQHRCCQSQSVPASAFADNTFRCGAEVVCVCVCACVRVCMTQGALSP